VVAPSDLAPAAEGFDPNAIGSMPLADGAPMPTEPDTAARADEDASPEAATEGTDELAEGAAPIPAWVAREAALRQQYDREFAQYKAGLQQSVLAAKAREVAQAQSGAQLAAAQLQVSDQWLDSLFHASQGEPVVLTRADLMEFRWNRRNAHDQVAAQQAQQFQQAAQQATTGQQVVQDLAARQTERATELGYGAEGLRQLQQTPAYQSAFQSFSHLAQQHIANRADKGLEQAAIAARMAVTALEEQWAASWKARPAVKAASRNLAKQDARGVQDRTSRTGGASGGSRGDQLRALQARTLQDHPNDPFARQAAYLQGKAAIDAQFTSKR